MLKSFCCLIRMLLQSVEEVVSWLQLAKLNNSGHNISNTSVISALVRRGEKDEETACFNDWSV